MHIKNKLFKNSYQLVNVLNSFTCPNTTFLFVIGPWLGSDPWRSLSPTWDIPWFYDSSCQRNVLKVSWKSSDDLKQTNKQKNIYIYTHTCAHTHYVKDGVFFSFYT